MKICSIAAVLLLAASAQAQFNAGIISLDLYLTQFGYVPAYGPGGGVIGTTGDFWNSMDISTVGSLNGLKASDGTVTSVGFSGIFGGDEAQTASGTYGLLFDVANQFSSFGSGQSGHITGLTPNAQYNLFLYSYGNSSGISVNGISFSSADTAGPYNSLIAGTDYSEHTVTADGSGNLDLVSMNGGGDSSFSAFQLEAIPEPSTLALVALGASLLVAARRKSRRQPMA